MNNNEEKLTEEERFYDEWIEKHKEILEEENEPVIYHDSMEWKEKDSWKSILEEIKRSYAIVLNYGGDNANTMSVNGFCITDLIDISELEYKRGVSSDEEVKNVIVEFTSYEEKDGTLQINPEYKIYMPLIKLLDLIKSSVGSKNQENMYSMLAQEAYHKSIFQMIKLLQNMTKTYDSSELKGMDIGEENISLDKLDATYVRIDPETKESQALGSNYSVALYSLGKVLRKTLVKTPNYDKEEEYTYGRTR